MWVYKLSVSQAQTQFNEQFIITDIPIVNIINEWYERMFKMNLGNIYIKNKINA